MKLLRPACAAFAIGTLVAIGAADASRAACLRQTPAQLRQQAHAIFDGVALDGVTSSGVQRLRVTRYRKGTGAVVVRVSTGWRRAPDGSLVVMSEGVTPRKGEPWRIFVASTVRGVAQTSLCSGSRRL